MPEESEHTTPEPIIFVNSLDETIQPDVTGPPNNEETKVSISPDTEVPTGDTQRTTIDRQTGRHSRGKV